VGWQTMWQYPFAIHPVLVSSRCCHGYWPARLVHGIFLGVEGAWSLISRFDT